MRIECMARKDGRTSTSCPWVVHKGFRRTQSDVLNSVPGAPRRVHRDGHCRWSSAGSPLRLATSTR